MAEKGTCSRRRRASHGHPAVPQLKSAWGASLGRLRLPAPGQGLQSWGTGEGRVPQGAQHRLHRSHRSHWWVATPGGMTSIWGDGAMGRTSLGEQGKQAQPQRTFTEPPQTRSKSTRVSAHQAGGSRATPKGPERCPAPSTIPQIFLQTKLPLAWQGCSVCVCMCFQPSL